MTENGALSHANQEEVRFGTGGNAIAHRGNKVFPPMMKFSPGIRHWNDMGYYKEPAMTSEIFTADGFIKTGDCGKARRRWLSLPLPGV